MNIQWRPPAWSKQDLFFLTDSLQHGRPVAEVATFLLRDENEVWSPRRA
jgi:hypothetical protein